MKFLGLTRMRKMPESADERRDQERVYGAFIAMLRNKCKNGTVSSYAKCFRSCVRVEVAVLGCPS